VLDKQLPYGFISKTMWSGTKHDNKKGARSFTVGRAWVEGSDWRSLKLSGFGHGNRRKCWQSCTFGIMDRMGSAALDQFGDRRTPGLEGLLILSGREDEYLRPARLFHRLGACREAGNSCRLAAIGSLSSRTKVQVHGRLVSTLLSPLDRTAAPPRKRVGVTQP